MTRSPGRAIYTAMLNAHGGFESDLTALRLADDAYRLYVGTGAIKRDLTWLRRNLGDGEQVDLTDETEDYAVLSLMGPNSPDIVGRLGGDALNQLGYFRHARAQLAGIEVEAVRLSFVGEAGWELTCRKQDAPALFGALHACGAQPAGLFAMTSMRIEKRFLAYGHDIDSDTDPLQAGLDFAIDWDSDFIGKPALFARREQPVSQRLVSIVLDDADAQPLGNEPVYHDGCIIGKTTSAAFGYRVGKPVAIALLDSENGISLDGLDIEVDIARTPAPGKTSLRPIFDPDGSRMRS